MSVSMWNSINTESYCIGILRNRYADFFLQIFYSDCIVFYNTVQYFVIHRGGNRLCLLEEQKKMEYKL